jgi:PA14 domain-containing protein
MRIARRRLLVAALSLAAVAGGAPAAHAEPQPGLKAEYFDYTDLTGKVAERIDLAVNFDWDLDEPVPGVGQDFSARWTGVVTPPQTRTYTFVTRADDGVRLWVDGNLVIDDWSLHAAADRSGSIVLQAGHAYPIRLEYFDGLKHAFVRLSWRWDGHPKEVVPTSALATEAPAPPSEDDGDDDTGSGEPGDDPGTGGGGGGSDPGTGGDPDPGPGPGPGGSGSDPGTGGDPDPGPGDGGSGGDPDPGPGDEGSGGDPDPGPGPGDGDGGGDPGGIPLPGDIPTGVGAIEMPKVGGVAAVVVPAGDTYVPEIGPIDLLAGNAPSIVSYGGPLEPPAPPVAGATFNAAPEPGGEVLVRRPADGQLIPLEQGASLPVGTHVDAREGGVDLQTAPAVGVDRPTQDMHFEGGMFRVGQSAKGQKVVDIDLLHGEFKEACGPLSKAERRAIRRRGAVARAAGVRKSRVLRRLWGKGKGRFRTRGRHAAATVRGTSWSIADRCDETSVRVHEGVVDVENLLTGAVVTLTAGERYAVRP